MGICNLKKIPDFNLDQTKPLGSILAKDYLSTFHQAIHFVHQLSYQRISDLDQLELVAVEKRGTCSTKHGFLAALAHENSFFDIQVKLIYFPFYSHYLPEFKEEFQKYKINHVLEAHCLLDYKGTPLDITSSKFDATKFYSIQNAIRIDTLLPSQVGTFKQKENVREYASWCAKNNLEFEPLWGFRMQLIKFLVKLDQLG